MAIDRIVAASGKYGGPGGSFFDTLEREAERRCEVIVAKAREEAARIVAEARQTAEENRQIALREEEAHARTELEDARRRAEAEMERANVTMRERVADLILDTVHEELRRIAQGPKFPEVLRLLLAEIMEEAPDDAILLAPPEHVSRCRQWLDVHGMTHIAVEPDKRLWDGVEVIDAARSFRLTNTLTSRFEKSRASARKAALRRLFGDNP
ncbi:MAG: V-type ATP synthase subunit E [Candidatus Hydrogenedentes bacterium]|nr:V-type ATP synthase subunit E [Candidatus Hydrogenedentota bacterium]